MNNQSKHSVITENESDNAKSIQKESTKNRRLLFLVVVVCIVIISVLFLNFLFIMLSCFPEILEYCFGIELKGGLDYSQRVESSIISSGITIIGVVITVWTGLNIVNILDKRYFDNLEQNVSNLNVKVTKLNDEAKKYSGKFEELNNNVSKLNREAENYQKKFLSLKRELTKFNLELKRQENERKNAQIRTDKMRLLQEMYITLSDESTKILIKKIESDRSDIPYLKLVEIEQKYRSVYQAHQDKFFMNYQLIKIANEGIGLAQEIIQTNTKNYNRTLEVYLNYRIAEFNFYKGYCVNIERKECYENSIKIYYKYYSDFGAQVPKFVDNFVYLKNSFVKFYVADENRTITAYMCNSIGESYSKIIQIKNELIKNNLCSIIDIQEMERKAVFYCLCANYLVAKSVYKRNFGCVLERVYGICSEHKDEILRIYSDALNLDANNINNFINLLSAYRKIIYKDIHILDLPEPDVGALQLCDNINSFSELWKKTPINDRNEARQFLNLLHIFAKRAKTLHARSYVGFEYECFYYCVISLISLSDHNGSTIDDDSKNLRQYISFAEENLEILQMLKPNSVEYESAENNPIKNLQYNISLLKEELNGLKSTEN